MNELTTGQRKPINRSEQAAKSFAAVKANLLAPFNVTATTKLMAWSDIVFNARSTEFTPEQFLEPTRGGQRAVEHAEKALSLIPPTDELASALKVIEPACEAAADATKIRALIGLMIDSFPNAAPHSPEVYMEGLVHRAVDAKWPPSAVAQACDELATTMKFPPAPVEFIAACEASLKYLKMRRTVLSEALAVRQKIETAYNAARATLTDTEAGGLWPYEPVMAAQKAEDARRRDEAAEAARARRAAGEVQF